MVVVVPLTCKLPLIITNPSLPTVAGSIVSVAPKLLIKSAAIVMLPALTLPPVTLPVAEINPPVSRLPPVTLPVALKVEPDTAALLSKFPPVILLNAVKAPASVMLTLSPALVKKLMYPAGPGAR